MKNTNFEERISLVMKAYEMDGHVSRKTLMKLYGISQLDAGVLMRDFIHQNARDLKWHPTQSHYKIAPKLDNP